MVAKHNLDKAVQEAALKTSQALSQLTGTSVEVDFTRIGFEKQVDQFEHIPPETNVAGIYLPISGKMRGATLLLMPEKIAHAFCDLLCSRKVGATKEFSELDKSALKEVGNIVCGHVLTVLSKVFKTRFLEKAPYLSFDKFGTLMNVLCADVFANVGEAFVVQVEFRFAKEDVAGQVILIFEMAEIKAIEKAMKGES